MKELDSICDELFPVPEIECKDKNNRRSSGQ